MAKYPSFLAHLGEQFCSIVSSGESLVQLCPSCPQRLPAVEFTLDWSSSLSWLTSPVHQHASWDLLSSELLVPTFLSQGLCFWEPTLRQQCRHKVTLEVISSLLDLQALPVYLQSYVKRFQHPQWQPNITQFSLSHLCILFSTLNPSCWNLKPLYHLMIFFPFSQRQRIADHQLQCENPLYT